MFGEMMHISNQEIALTIRPNDVWLGDFSQIFHRVWKGRNQLIMAPARLGGAGGWGIHYLFIYTCGLV